MRRFTYQTTIAMAAIFGFVSIANAEVYGLKPGAVEFQSVGPMTFGPSGVLFVGDSKAAKIYAIDTADKGKAAGKYAFDDLGTELATALNVSSVEIKDLAVNPETGRAFLAVSDSKKSQIVQVDPGGSIKALDLSNIGHAVAEVPNPPEDKEVKRGRRSRNMRSETITDIAYTDGKVIVSGLSAGEAPSSVREFEFPFREGYKGMQVQIYHAAHGRDENYAAIQTFVPFNLGGEPTVLAGFTCTPLVKIPIAKIGESSQVTGTTVAELGNRNRPFDMITYSKEGQDYLLIANTARGIMKVPTAGLDEVDGLTERVPNGKTAGQGYETIDSLRDISELAKIDDQHAVVIIQANRAPISMATIDLP